MAGLSQSSINIDAPCNRGGGFRRTTTDLRILAVTVSATHGLSQAAAVGKGILPVIRELLLLPETPCLMVSI